jgi:hypothetical protein
LLFDQSSRRNDNAHNSTARKSTVCMFLGRYKASFFAEFGRSRSTRRRSRKRGKFEDRGSRLISGPNQSGFVKRRFVLHTRYRVGERDPEIHGRAENRAAPFQGP